MLNNEYILYGNEYTSPAFNQANTLSSGNKATQSWAIHLILNLSIRTKTNTHPFSSFSFTTDPNNPRIGPP